MNSMIIAEIDKPDITVLEAGGGSRSWLAPGRKVRVSAITTVDIDADQLARNDYATEKVLANLEAFRPGRVWDLVMVVNVLEHVDDVEAVLRNLAEVCAEDGLLLVGCPYMWSLSGMATRFTPHGVHVFHRRWLLGEKDAGKPGHPPFRTVYDPLIEPRRMMAFMARLGFSTRLLMFHESSVLRRLKQRHGILSLPLFAVIGLMNLLTPKSYNARNGEYLLLFRKGGLAAPAG
jgi:SAM-dependent methyltransferase